MYTPKRLYNTTLKDGYWWPKKEDEKAHQRGKSRTEITTQRIYILGQGNVGSFVGHSLAQLPDRPPITFLLSKRDTFYRWNQRGRTIEIVKDGIPYVQDGFDSELVPHVADFKNTTASDQSNPSNSGNSDVIYHLIVCLKAYATVNAIKDIAHRLKPESSILFLQNGMGILEEIDNEVFPDPSTRPHYMIGIISHGLYLHKPFSIVHAGQGTIVISILPRRSPESFLPSSPTALYLLRTMTRTPRLAAIGFNPTDLLQLQLEKLAINAIINPLTVAFDCTNGDLFQQPSAYRVMRLLLAEISLVIRSLPELQGVLNIKMRYAPGRLEGLVVNIAKATAANRSSMLQDVQKGYPVEIDYINGFIVKKGEELGIQCVLNYMMLHLVRAKSSIEMKKSRNILPLEDRSS
ncbi:MAG: hypothetical protein LQ351_006865 [Letrouitia transgressa]|nr:MAG: hypothetical protein LQ351_006865 [Letrouitia transgressa]